MFSDTSKGTKEQELCFKGSDTKRLGLGIYCDADWASDVTDRHSMTGYCAGLSEGSSLISWKSRKQPTVALSTCKAEYFSISLTGMYLLRTATRRHGQIQIYTNKGVRRQPGYYCTSQKPSKQAKVQAHR